jgi:biotin-(acetyl-CoA carboxylase) ligase
MAQLNKQLNRMQEPAGINVSNPVTKLIEILQQAIKLADENIDKADNFDLVDFSQTLEKYVSELNEIGSFETSMQE